MKSILVLAPHEDRAERAVTLASALAQRTQAKLTLLRVLEESIGSAATSHSNEQGRSLRDLLLEVETRRVEELAERTRAAGVEVSIEVCWGVPWEAVLDLVERDHHDLVVKPATGLNRQGQVFFGSTALHLFRRCTCPVWVVGDEGRLPVTILAAVDPSGAPRRRDAAERILDWAETVSTWSNATLEVATAWQAAGAGLLRGTLEDRELKQYVRSAYDRAREDFDALMRQRGNPPSPAHLHMVEGAAEEALPRIADEIDVDLIVMGTRGQEDRVGGLLGETAETIIRHVRSSVLTIPPLPEPAR